ncbi:MAG: WD40-repeat-containing domain protein [Monoraphidium minutum]|nr:MAG: WD40-repeat-containing domain protein [Monoraphidium minutum]
MFQTVWERGLGAGTAPHLERRKCSKSIDLVQRMQLERVLEGHQGCVNTVAFDPCGALLVSGSDDQTIRVWGFPDGKERLRWDSGHRNNVFQARFMPHTGNSVLVSCAADGQVRVADLPPGAGPRGVASRKLAQHDGRAHRLALDPLCDRSCFYSCGEDGEVMHFDLRLPQARCRRRLLVVHGAPGMAGPSVIDLNCIHCNPARPELFAVGGGDAWARIYDARRATSALGSAGAAPGGGGGGGGGLGRLFGMPDEPVARLAPARLAPRGGGDAPPRRRALSKHITGIQFSGAGELLATYNDDDIFLFDPEGYGGRRASGGAAAAEAQRPGQHWRRATPGVAAAAGAPRQRRRRRRRRGGRRRAPRAAAAAAAAGGGGRGR